MNIIECGGCAPHVVASETDRQADQRVADELRAERFASTERPKIKTCQKHGIGFVTRCMACELGSPAGGAL